MSPFEIILTVSLFCLGLREVTDDIEGGRIGYPVRKWFIESNWIPIYIAKPIILCAACMASFWGTIIYWFIMFHFNSDNDFLFDYMTYLKWVFCCVSASFVNTLFWVLRNRCIGLLNV